MKAFLLVVLVISNLNLAHGMMRVTFECSLQDADDRDNNRVEKVAIKESDLSDDAEIDVSSVADDGKIEVYTFEAKRTPFGQFVVFSGRITQGRIIHLVLGPRRRLFRNAPMAKLQLDVGEVASAGEGGKNEASFVARITDKARDKKFSGNLHCSVPG